MPPVVTFQEFSPVNQQGEITARPFQVKVAWTEVVKKGEPDEAAKLKCAYQLQLKITFHDGSQTAPDPQATPIADPTIPGEYTFNANVSATGLWHFHAAVLKDGSEYGTVADADRSVIA